MLSYFKCRGYYWTRMVYQKWMQSYSSACCNEVFSNELLATMLSNEQGHYISRDMIYDLLQGCLIKKDLESSRIVHSLMISNGHDFIAPLGDHLIRLFTLCKSLLEANRVFVKISTPSVFTWNAIISAHVNLGESNTAIDLFTRMKQEQKPDKVTFLYVLKACSTLQELPCGQTIHNEIIESGFEIDSSIGNTIIDMYVKCGSIQDARCVFDGLPNQDSISWSVVISGYVSLECYQTALELFEKMQNKDVRFTRVVVSCSLKACASMRSLTLGRLIHDKIEKLDTIADAFIGSALINMYASFGIIQEAQKVFYQIQNKNAQLWAEMISGYIEHSFYYEAADLFGEMQRGGFQPDKPACLRLLKACGNLGTGRQCMIMHHLILRTGLETDTMVGNTLVDVYGKCGYLRDAQKIFNSVKKQDVVSWSVMISGYAQHGDGHHAINLFNKMQAEGISPSKVSFLGVLKACANTGNVHQGRLIHDQIASTQLMSDVLIASTLIDMYAKCGSLEEAHEVFDCVPNRNVVVWSAMIAGYAQHGFGVPALELYKSMLKENIAPDKVLFASVLQACTCIGELEQGRIIHDQAIRDSCDAHLVVGNTLVDLYAKCGSMEEARRIFDNMLTRDVVSWATMISGYAHHGFSLAALQLFESTQESLESNRVVFLGLLKACGSLGAVQQGQMIHNGIIEGGLESDLVICNTLLDMYTRSSSLKDARAIFDRMHNRDEVSWSSMISGYAWCGEWDQLKQCIQTMQQHGMKPDDVTFTNVLNTCSHAGRLDEGCWFFRFMRDDHGIIPSIEHYSCLVDLLSRSGCLTEAADLLESIPIHPDLIIWLSLLTSCKIYGNKCIGERCFDYSLLLDANDASGYILLSEIYIDAKTWLDDDRMIHSKMIEDMNCTTHLKEMKEKDYAIVEDEDYPKFDQLRILLRQLNMTSSSLISEYKSGFHKHKNNLS